MLGAVPSPAHLSLPPPCAAATAGSALQRLAHAPTPNGTATVHLGLPFGPTGGRRRAMRATGRASAGSADRRRPRWLAWRMAPGSCRETVRRGACAARRPAACPHDPEGPVHALRGRSCKLACRRRAAHGRPAWAAGSCTRAHGRRACSGMAPAFSSPTRGWTHARAQPRQRCGTPWHLTTSTLAAGRLWSATRPATPGARPTSYAACECVRARARARCSTPRPARWKSMEPRVHLPGSSTLKTLRCTHAAPLAPLSVSRWQPARLTSLAVTGKT